MIDKETLDRADQVLAATKDLNDVMLANVDKLARMNIDLVENLSQIGFENYEAARGIKSIDELKEYAQKQRETAQSIAERIAQDNATIVQMISDYMANAQQAAGTTVASLGSKPFGGVFGALSNTMSLFKVPQATATKFESKGDNPPDDTQ